MLEILDTGKTERWYLNFIHYSQILCPFNVLHFSFVIKLKQGAHQHCQIPVAASDYSYLQESFQETMLINEVKDTQKSLGAGQQHLLNGSSNLIKRTKIYFIHGSAYFSGFISCHANVHLWVVMTKQCTTPIAYILGKANNYVSICHAVISANDICPCRLRSSVTYSNKAYQS